MDSNSKGEQPLVLTDWNVWYNYSSYFLGKIDLEAGVKNLVASQFCKIAFHTDGTVVMDDNGHPRVAKVEIKRFGHDDKATVVLPSASTSLRGESADYIRECCLQAATARVHEMKQFSVFTLRDIPYVRGFLEPFRMTHADGGITKIYPQMKLYENGVFTLAFRLIGPTRPINSDDFVERYVNLFAENTKDIELPPSLLKLDTVTFLLGRFRNPFLRARLARATKRIFKTIDRATRRDDQGSFIFKSAKLDPEKTLEDPVYNLESFIEFSISALCSALDTPRTGIGYVVLNQKASRHIWGDLWSGRPSVYILGFKGQPDTASAIRERYKNQLYRILSRVTSSFNSAQHRAARELKVF